MRLFSRITLLSGLVALLLPGLACVDVSREVTQTESQEVTLTVLQTSDVHGRLTNYDYTRGVEDKCGLVKCATIINQERKKDPQLVLVDCGDISQGNLISEFRYDPIPPVAKLMNAMKYDFWQVGNHEFNFDYSTLQANIVNFNGTVLGGNIYEQDGQRVGEPFIIRNIRGVKVAFVGVVAPHIPNWESDPSHYNAMTFTSPMVEIGKIIQELTPINPDVTIVMAHYSEMGEMGEPGMYEVGAKYGDAVAAYLIGHAHNELLKYYNGQSWEDQPTENMQTCLMEPGINAQNVGKLTLKLQKDAYGKWTLKDRHVELLSCAEAAPDPEIASVLQDVHERSLALSNRVVGRVTHDFADDPLLLPHIPKAILAPSAIVNLINTVMLKNSGADIAMGTLLDENANVQAGKFRFKDACNLYKYDNSLMAVVLTGKQLKRIMEKYTGGFFNTPVPGDVTLSFTPEIRFYDYAIFKGINYEIDMSQPEGQRITNLTYKGKPLDDKQELTMALNNHSFGMLSHDGFVNDSQVVYNSTNQSTNAMIREMIVQYVEDQKVIEPTIDYNWEIVGCHLDDPQKELIYQMIREGKIQIPCTDGGRSINSQAINANKLREQKILPDLAP